MFTCSGDPCFAKLGSYVYFGGGLLGDYELWRTDGTNAGTKLVKNISASLPSSPGHFVTVGTWVYFTAASDGITPQLWRTNGSTTTQITHLSSTMDGTGNPSIDHLTRLGSSVYFTATVFPYGAELWKVSGTTATMVDDIVVGGVGSAPSLLTAVGSTLYFVAADTTHGAEVWRTKGSTSSTWMVADVSPGSGSPQASEIAGFGGKTYVALKDPNNLLPIRGLDVVSSDDRGLEELNDATQSSTAHLTSTSSYLLFSAFGQSGDGIELWRTDGTPLGTQEVADIAPGNTSSNPSQLVRNGSSTYFLVDYPTAAGAIYKTNGTSVALAFPATTLDGTVVGVDTPPSFDHLVAAGGKTFFGAYTHNHSFELWDTDGVHVTRLSNLVDTEVSGYPAPLFTINSRVFFYTDDSRLWSASY
ncbi:MAG TPA: hypothetical protein VF479_00635 [Pseudolysinimonas sp.]